MDGFRMPEREEGIQFRTIPPAVRYFGIVVAAARRPDFGAQTFHSGLRRGLGERRRLREKTQVWWHSRRTRAELTDAHMVELGGTIPTDLPRPARHSGAADFQGDADRIEPVLGLCPKLLLQLDENSTTVAIIAPPLDEIEILQLVETTQRRGFRDLRRTAQAGNVDRLANAVGDIELENHIPARLAEGDARKTRNPLLTAFEDDPGQSLAVLPLVKRVPSRREYHAFDDGSGEFEPDSDSRLLVCEGHGGLAPDRRCASASAGRLKVPSASANSAR